MLANPVAEIGALDRHYTPQWMARALLDFMPCKFSRVLEPCAGSGSIADVLRQEGYQVTTGDTDPGVDVDVRWDFPAAVANHNAYQNTLLGPTFGEAVAAQLTGAPVCLEASERPGVPPVPSRLPNVEAVVSNPPFKTLGPDGRLQYRATDFVEAALAYPGVQVVAMLLRLSWLEPCSKKDRRGRIFADRPPVSIVVLPRGNFRGPDAKPGGGSDRTCCAWFIWRRLHPMGFSRLPGDLPGDIPTVEPKAYRGRTILPCTTQMYWVHPDQVAHLSGQTYLEGV